MSSTGLMFGLCMALALVQGLAALPWLLAVEPRLRIKIRQTSAWGLGLLICLGAGLILALFFQANSDPKALARGGRVYLALLHLQLGADVLVGVFFWLLTAWPKGGAVALAAFREGVRQPMFWVLAIGAMILMVLSPFIPYFTFGEDQKVVRELCFAFTMMAAALFGVVEASISVTEEIEGRTAVTLMSKPVSRRHFLLGKFSGILLAALAMTLLLGWILIWINLLKNWYDNPNPREDAPIPRWIMDTKDAFNQQFGVEVSSAGDVVQGLGLWLNDALEAVPYLVIGFGQVMVLLAIAVALATRLPMMVSMIICFLFFFLGHLTSIMTEVTQGKYPLIAFVARLFETLLPGLDLFDVSTAIFRDSPLHLGDFFVYSLQISLYAVIYTTIALLVGLFLFEDRDLA